MMIKSILSFNDFTKLTPQEMYGYVVNMEKQLQYAGYEVAQLRQKLFGRQSERSTVLGQQPLLTGFDRLFDETSSDEEEGDPEEAQTSEDSRETLTSDEPDTPKKKRGRKPLPEHLTRERRVHDISESHNTNSQKY